VWVGLAEDVAPDGSVANPAAAYSTRWATTHEPGGAWGYNSLDTGKFGFGASQLFEHDCFGHESVSGDPALCPEPAAGADAAELFNRVGALWKSTFAHAVALGVATVLGTEIPLAMPEPAPPAPPGPGATLPLQLWYSAERNDHFVTTTPCAECDGMYTLLGVTGWVYANNETGSTPLCTYAKALANGQIDNELRPCRDSTGAVRIEGYAPEGGAAGTESLFACINGEGHHWAADSNWSALAQKSGFTCTPGLAPAFTSGPPLPAPQDAQDYYEGIFTRLVRLLGNNLTYYVRGKANDRLLPPLPSPLPPSPHPTLHMRPPHTPHTHTAPSFAVGLDARGLGVGQSSSNLAPYPGRGGGHPKNAGGARRGAATLCACVVRVDGGPAGRAVVLRHKASPFVDHFIDRHGRR
jgi:hypothetical protein